MGVGDEFILDELCLQKLQHLSRSARSFFSILREITKSSALQEYPSVSCSADRALFSYKTVL
jgi:hypothetical protein